MFIVSTPNFIKVPTIPTRTRVQLRPISAVYNQQSSPAAARSAASHYEALGLSSTATAQDIKSAYRRLALTCHPDAGASAEEFMRIHTAYATLSDPGKRVEYDRVNFGFRVRSDLSGLARRRTWETDQCW